MEDKVEKIFKISKIENRREKVRQRINSGSLISKRVPKTENRETGRGRNQKRQFKKIHQS